MQRGGAGVDRHPDAPVDVEEDQEEGAQRTLAGDAGDTALAFRSGSWAQPSDVADAVVFLLSDMSGHITMHELCVDGGAALGA